MAARFALALAVVFLTAAVAPAQDDALDAAAREFVAKVLAATRPAKAISLNIEVLTPLPASVTVQVRALLEEELLKRSTVVSRTPEDEIRLRFAESSTSLLWVAEVRIAGDVQTVFLEVPRSAIPAEEAGVQVAMRAKRIWQQEVPLLFAGEVKTTGSPEARMILFTRNELIQLSRAAPGASVVRRAVLPRRAPPLRADAASVEATEAGMKAQFTKEACLIPWEDSAEMKCSPAAAPARDSTAGTSHGQKSHRLAGAAEGVDTAGELACASGRLYLYTGDGDWTMPDKLQAQLGRGDRSLGEVERLDFPGPILSLSNGVEDGKFFAVVRNLKSSRYEVYAIVAVCVQ